MVKKRTTINLDEDLYNLAKKEISNLSEFVESCLKIKLNISDYYSHPDKEKKLRKITNQIDNLLFERNLLIKLQSEQNFKESRENNKKQFIWRKLIHNYLKYKVYDQEELENACDILDISEDELLNKLEKLYGYSLYCDSKDVNNLKTNYEFANKLYMSL